MTHKLLNARAFAVTAILAGCSVEPDLAPAPEAEDGLVIARADEQGIVGTYGENGRGLDFELERAGGWLFANVGVRDQMLIESVFHDRSATTTILDRLTFVRTDAGIETIGDYAALDDFSTIPESALLDPLRAALRTHGIVDEIVTIP